ncbi:MAG: translocation/assembly module TamB domain-containing protein [Pseudomonadota bacterium]
MLLLTAIPLAGLALLDSAAGHRWLLRELSARVEGVRIAGLEGSLFSRLRLIDLGIADDEGVWLRVPQLSIAWRPWGLLRRGLSIAAIEAETVEVLRPPQGKDGQAPSGGLALPRLPFDITLDRLVIDRIRYTPPDRAPILARFSGRLDWRRGKAIRLFAAVDPAAEETGDRARLDLVYAPGARALTLELTAEAPAGGLIGGLLGLDAPLAVRLTGDGPYEEWRGTGAISLAGAPLFATDIAHGEDGWQLAFTAETARLLTGDALRLVGRQVTGALGIERAEDGRWRLAGGLAMEAGEMAWVGHLDLGAAPAFATGFSLTMEVPAENDWLDERIGQPVGAVTLEGELSGPVFAPHAHARARLARLGAPGAMLDRLSAGGLDLAAELSFSEDWRRLDIARLTGGAAALQLKGAMTLGLRTGRLEGGFAVSLPSLAVLNGDASLLDGALAGDINLQRQGRGLPLAFAADLGAARLASPHPALQRLAAGPLRLTVDGALDGPAVIVHDLALVGAGIEASAKGRYEAARLLVNAETRLGDAAALFAARPAPLSGALRLSAQVEGPLDALYLKARLEGTRAQLAEVAFTAPRLTLDGRLAEGLAVRLNAEASGQALQASGRLRRAPNWTAEDIALAFGPWQATGALALDAAGKLGGEARLSLAPAGPGEALLFGLDAKARATLVFSPLADGQRIDFEMSAEKLRWQAATPLRVDGMTMQGRLGWGGAGPRLTLDGTAQGIDIAGHYIDRLSATATRAGSDTRAQVRLSALAPAPAELELALVFSPQGTGAWTLKAGIEGTINGQAVASEAPLRLTVTGGDFALAPFALRAGAGRVLGAFTWAGERQDLSLRMEAVPLGLARGLGGDWTHGGRVNGLVTLEREAKTVAGALSLRIEDILPRADLPDERLALALDGRLTGNAFTGGAQAYLDDAQVARLTASVRMDWPADALLPQLDADAPLDGRLEVDSSLAPLWALVGEPQHLISGTLESDLGLAGTPAAPRLEGALRLVQGRYENLEVGLIFTDIAADVAINGQKLELRRLSAGDGNGGTLTISGAAQMALGQKGPWPGAARLELRDFWVLRRDDLRAKASGGVDIASAKGALNLSGKLNLERAEITLKDSEAASIPTIAYEEVNGVSEEMAARQAEGAPLPIQLDVAVRAERRMFVRGLGLNSEWSADLKITGPSNQAAITGEARLVRGDLDFAGRRFELERGLLSFTGGRRIDPRLDILASNSREGLTATITVTGTASKPQLNLSSSPPLPTDEILSRILFGNSVANLSALEAVQLASALTTLRGGGGLNVLGAARSGIGLDRLSVGTGTSATAITGGKYLTDDVYVEVTTDPSTGQTGAAVEWGITRRLSLLSRFSGERDATMSLRWSRDY